MHRPPLVGLIGATSFVGGTLVPMIQGQGRQVIAYSRTPKSSENPNVQWRMPLTEGQPIADQENIPLWICVAPIWVFPQYFEMIKTCGCKRLVALSSTSRCTKSTSYDEQERLNANRMEQGESRLKEWAEKNGIEWVVLRPTLIYGRSQDKNISEIARFVRRFGFFPVFGEAHGLRQPIRVEDVAGACLAALEAPEAANHAYNITGKETFTYREMVGQIFLALGRKPHIISIPLWIFSIALRFARLIPRYKHWNAAMAERMNRDLAFDYSDAARDLGFSPQPLTLGPQDLPP